MSAYIEYIIVDDKKLSLSISRKTDQNTYLVFKWFIDLCNIKTHLSLGSNWRHHSHVLHEDPKLVGKASYIITLTFGDQLHLLDKK